MMSNLSTPVGDPPLKLGVNFSLPLRVRVWTKLFLATVPEKEYPKLVLKFWGLPQKLA